MNYFDELERINAQIEMIRNHSEYLLNNMDEIEEQNNAQLEDVNRSLEPGKADVNSICTREVLRKEMTELQQAILNLNSKREEIIRTILNASKLSVQDVIILMDKFKSYHRTERIENKTYIVPQDFYLLRTGANSIVSKEQLVEEVTPYFDVLSKTKRSAYCVPMYIKTANGTQENDQILTVVAGLEVNDFEGVQIYKRENNEIIFNGNILNLFPYDVIAFLDYLVTSRFANPKLTMEEAWQQYKLGNTKVLTFSKEDPALEDIYRNRK